MSKNNEPAQSDKTKYGYYRIEVCADKVEDFVEVTFYDTTVDVSEDKEFPSEEDFKNDVTKIREFGVRKVRGHQEIIVRDYRANVPPREIVDTVRIKAKEIIDPIDRSRLGNYAEFGKNVKFKYVVTAIDPPHQVPIINGRFLRIKGSIDYLTCQRREISVRVHDLKLGDFSFNARSVILHGVDLRVQGNEIDINGKRVDLAAYQHQRTASEKWYKMFWHYVLSKLNHLKDGEKGKSTKDAEYLLIVKGSAMRIDGVRADNIDTIYVSDDFELKTVIEGVRENKLPAWINWLLEIQWRVRIKSVGYSFKLFILLCVLGVMTFIPFCKDDYIREKYQNLCASIPASAVVVTSKPTGVSNKLSVQVVGATGDTNQVTTTSTSTSSASDELSFTGQERKTQGGGVITFYFVVACLLYVLFYFLIMLLTIATFKAMRRHNKMTRNMSSVLEALRNERDKDKRKAMQKKILDDMINTYLDKPSSED